jgi:hypothetical protein
MWNRLAIDLPMGRVRWVSAVKYQNVDGSWTVLDPSLYRADLSGIPCRLTPSQSSAGGMVWPWQGTYLPGSVRIVYEAASYVQPIAEPFTVPVAPGPYTYQLDQLPVTAVEWVADAAGDPVTGWSVSSSGLLTLPVAQAGASLVANYCIANCPASVQLALLMLVGHFYRNPEATTDLEMEQLPFGVQSLLSSEVIDWTDYRPC